MKIRIVLLMLTVFAVNSFHSSAQTSVSETPAPKAIGKNLYIDVHQLEPGKVKYEDVAKAHAKDLAVEKKYGVNFIKYWVNEEKGLVYCLSSSADTESIRKTHAEAHGLLPGHIYQVTNGLEAVSNGKKDFFLDVHYLGAGNVTAKDVAAAHKKDLAVQQKHGVNFINYWVDEKDGVVMCLSQAKDSASVIETHKEAHGLIPASVLKVKQGE
jgi:phenolic acid decarboxylase